MSDTPRTDRQSRKRVPRGDERVSAAFARQLERELAAMAATYETSHQSRLHAERCVERLEGELAELLAVIEIVRCHPDFDNGGPMADAMDQALRREPIKLVSDVACLRQGRQPPDDLDTPSRLTGIHATCDAYVRGRDSDYCQRCGLGLFDHGQIY